jgi:hypothetical protein
MWQEIEEAFAEPVLPDQPSRAAEFKVIGPPASEDHLTRMLAVCGGALPASYLAFLRESDGAEGGTNDGGDLTLWGSKVLDERRPTEALAELLPIGSDGLGSWVGFQRAAQDPESWPVVRWDVATAPTARRELAATFQEWRKDGFPLRPGGVACCGG